MKFSLVTLTSRFEATQGLFWTDFVLLNRGQMTRTTPGLALQPRSGDEDDTCAGTRTAVGRRGRHLAWHPSSPLQRGRLISRATGPQTTADLQ
ncbi:hypothetical protein AVEN_72260-1 [Araneus ventricosus]|uniref:Uncharacterized protein n=1 Tax=Araneus ventricosus TaxID=182803 RepID=A0A4Y2RAZ0_ARAVE|nr:hypothetical protein AVEN_72260-1 [Araneus ventricosus]